jgi:mono/diheme cytochrome c family protein
MNWISNRRSPRLAACGASLAIIGLFAACGDDDDDTVNPPEESEGMEIFRFDTFGNEAFWTDDLHMNEVIQTSVSPVTALSVGLKVDSEKLPAGLLASADLNSPATTVELLRLDAVVGLKATVEGGTIQRFGITCALCHSNVDNSVMPGIGRRLDGWANRDLDPGRIISLSPFFDDQPDVRATLQSWGPGKYDAYFNYDGMSDSVVMPPIYGLQDVPLETYSGEGPISYWNAYVAVTQMHGQGSFSDARLGINIQTSPDLVTPKLPALLEYQLSLETPAPPMGSFDTAAAARGQSVFQGNAQCASCHVPPTFTDAGTTLHDPATTGTNGLRAQRGTTDKYRTTPLRGLWQHPPYFHDGSAATLTDVVNQYITTMGLTLTEQEKADLIEYLKSL